MPRGLSWGAKSGIGDDAGACATACGESDRDVGASETDSDTATWGDKKGAPGTGVAAMLRAEDAVAGI